MNPAYLVKFIIKVTIHKKNYQGYKDVSLCHAEKIDILKFISKMFIFNLDSNIN